PTAIKPIPLLASLQGGVAERLINVAEPPLTARPGWFSDRQKRKTTPAASVSVASQYFLDDAATPPCGDARRGITPSKKYSPLFPQLLLILRNRIGKFPPTVIVFQQVLRIVRRYVPMDAVLVFQTFVLNQSGTGVLDAVEHR